MYTDMIFQNGIIIGSAMEVLNTIGHGFLEKPYENALAVELKLRGLTCKQQSRFDIIRVNLCPSVVLWFLKCF